MIIAINEKISSTDPVMLTTMELNFIEKYYIEYNVSNVNDEYFVLGIDVFNRETNELVRHFEPKVRYERKGLQSISGFFQHGRFNEDKDNVYIEEFYKHYVSNPKIRQIDNKLLLSFVFFFIDSKKNIYLLTKFGKEVVKFESGFNDYTNIVSAVEMDIDAVFNAIVGKEYRYYFNKFRKQALFLRDVSITDSFAYMEAQVDLLTRIVLESKLFDETALMSVLRKSDEFSILGETDLTSVEKKFDLKKKIRKWQRMYHDKIDILQSKIDAIEDAPLNERILNLTNNLNLIARENGTFDDVASLLDNQE